ncbi:MAG TPA: SDR family oxidoreductase [Pyrinomonadaceae bacterium]|nr:SDR family oxidoreductase [Pyrinomonadaceae bacterium]
MEFKKTIFLTGFPGFIAERLVARLAEKDVQFFLLVQQQFVEKAMAAIEKIAEKTETPLENFALIAGDITQKNLGIADEDLETIRSETTDVFHLAAVYDLAVDKDLATRVNLEGTTNVSDFARSVEDLSRYNYISTCYVAGKRKGKILESDLEHDAGFRNYYEETKYLAEREVENLKEELPVTIYRPSVVVGDSRTGETVKYDGIYYLIQYLRKAPNLLRFVNVGNKAVRLNLVPVDFVVEAIAALSDDEKAVGKTIAIADPYPLTTAELFDSIAFAMTKKRSAFTPPPKLVEWSLSQPFSPPVTGLPLYGVPYFFLAQTYDTSVANELLPPHGIACPDFKDYVGNLIKFVEKNPEI